jgi:diguanylate cyclase
MDLDNFKMLNDTLGHQYGDQCLSEFGNILKRNCLDGSTPFRYGGDEFCILMKNIETDNALNMCKNIQYDLKNYMISESTNIHLAVSIGIAHHKKGMSPTQLVKNADLALYRSKASHSSIFIWDEGFEN